MDRTTDMKVMKRVGERYALFKTIQRRNGTLNWSDVHHEWILQTIIEGRVDVNSARGRPRKQCVASDIGLTVPG